MKTHSTIAALLAVPMLAACTSASLTWLDGGKMQMTYEIPHIQANVEEAFAEAKNRMNVLCMKQGGDKVFFGDLVLPKPTTNNNPQSEVKNNSAILNAAKEIAGKTSVTIQGTCVRH